MSPTTTAERHLRADARRNRDKILVAAEAAFRAQGLAVQMEDIARRADVGVGTLYRHFPTKEALVVELSTRRFGTCIAQAEKALESSDGWAAIESFVNTNAEQMSRDVGLRDTFTAAGKDDERCRGERRQLERRLADLLDRARDEGGLRPDVTAQDVQALMCGLSGAIASGGDWRKLARIILAGLRSPS